MRDYLLSSAAMRRVLLGLSLAAGTACSATDDPNKRGADAPSAELNPGPDLPRDTRAQVGVGGQTSAAQRTSALEREAAKPDDSASEDSASEDSASEGSASEGGAGEAGAGE
jgi:hypothetical protein